MRERNHSDIPRRDEFSTVGEAIMALDDGLSDHLLLACHSRHVYDPDVPMQIQMRWSHKLRRLGICAFYCNTEYGMCINAILDGGQKVGCR